MRVLILDDDRSRHRVLSRYIRDYFGDWAKSAGESIAVGHAYTLSDFVRKYSEPQRWDVVLLDYDLHLCQLPEYVGKDLACGEHAAKMIALDRHAHKPPMVFVHSLNDAGARRMVRLMLDAGMNVSRNPYTDRGLDVWLNG